MNQGMALFCVVPQSSRIENGSIDFFLLGDHMGIAQETQMRSQESAALAV